MSSRERQFPYLRGDELMRVLYSYCAYNRVVCILLQVHYQIVRNATYLCRYSTDVLASCDRYYILQQLVGPRGGGEAAKHSTAAPYISSIPNAAARVLISRDETFELGNCQTADRVVGLMIRRRARRPAQLLETGHAPREPRERNVLPSLQSSVPKNVTR